MRGLRTGRTFIPRSEALSLGPGLLRQSGILLQRRTFATVDSSAETHDDFKAKHKGEATGDAETTIKGDIAASDVFVYMKGTPDAPNCGFSNMACRCGAHAWIACHGIRGCYRSLAR